MSGSPFKRRKKIIKPRLQWRLIGSFVGILMLGMLLQYVLLAQQLTQLASVLPSDSSVLTANIPSLLTTVLLVSLFVLLPITIAVGVVMTFKIAGPVYRFEQHLKAIARGEDPGVCRIRKADELGELCEALNRAIASLKDGSNEAESPQIDETKRAA